MTPEERTMLQDLADKIQKTPPPPKDAEAEEFIRKNIGSRPDALYLMTQTVLIQNLALEHAQQQIRELQERAGQPVPASSGSFLGGAPRSGGYAQSTYAQPAASPAPQQPPPPQYNAPSPAPPSPSGAGSFLRGAAQTAAGVAAGALAFEGIRSLFSHPGLGGWGGYGYGGAPVDETIIENNYYDQPAPGSQPDLQDQNAQDLQDQGNLQDVNDAGQYDDGSNYDDNGDMGDGGDMGDVGGFDDGGSWT
jgi:hypothetical protein